MNMYHNVNICNEAHVPLQDSRTRKGNKYSSSGVLVRDGFAVVGTVLFNCLQMTLHFLLHTCPCVCVCDREKEIQRERENSERDMTHWFLTGNLIHVSTNLILTHLAERTNSHARVNKEWSEISRIGEGWGGYLRFKI